MLKVITRSYKGYDESVNEHWRVEAPALLISENVLMYLEDHLIVFEYFMKPFSHDVEVVEVSYDARDFTSIQIEVPNEIILNYGLLNLAEMSIAELGVLLFKN